jgi:hypothetical protein
MESNEVRAIVPGRQDKLNTATLRPIVVQRLNEEGPLALANSAIKLAEKTYKGFHAVYSALYVMIAMPQAEPDLIFEGLWQMLMLPDSEKVILTVITVDSEGAQLDIETKNVPVGWRWEWMEIGLSGDTADKDDIFDDEEISSPYDGDDAIPSSCSSPSYYP